MGKQYIVPFNMNEDEIRKNFLDWVILGDNTPIDIAYKAEITGVTKKFYPIRAVSSEYKAEWSALSIWEHTEEYKVIVPMVKYKEVISYVSGTHQPSLTKIHVVTEEQYANSSTMQRWPIIDRFNKTEVKEKTVIDQKKQTQGSITGTYTQKVVLTESNNESLNKWLDSFPLEDIIDYSDKVISNATLKELPESDEYAHNLLIPTIKNKATDECKKEVPGTRYEEFSLDHMSDEYTVDVYYVPVYEITYEYNGQQFTALLSGCVKDSAYATEKPVDTDLEAKNKTMADKLESLKSERLKAGVIGIGAPIVIFIITLFFGLDTVAYIVLFLLLGGIGAFLTKTKFIPANTNVKEQEKVINVYKGNIDEKKKAILAIVNNDSLSAEEQKEQIKKLLEG